MKGLVVVFGSLDLPYRGLKVPSGSFGADHEANLTRWVSGDGGVGVFRNGEDVAGHLAQAVDQGKMQPEALSLSGDVSSRGQGIMKKLEVRLLEERLGGADGIRGVGDDNIVGSFVLGKELETISDEDSDLGRSKEGGHVREVDLGDTDNGL